MSLDLLFLIIYVICFIWGWWKGFFSQLFGFVGVIIGFVLAFLIYRQFYSIIVPADSSLVTQVVIFIVVWIAIPFACTFVGKVFTKVADTLFLGWLNKLLGAVLNCVKVTFFMSLLLTLFEYSEKIDPNPMVSKEAKEESVMYYPIQEFCGKVVPLKSLVFDRHGDEGKGENDK